MNYFWIFPVLPLLELSLSLLVQIQSCFQKLPKSVSYLKSPRFLVACKIKWKCLLLQSACQAVSRLLQAWASWTWQRSPVARPSEPLPVLGVPPPSLFISSLSPIPTGPRAASGLSAHPRPPAVCSDSCESTLRTFCADPLSSALFC